MKTFAYASRVQVVSPTGQRLQQVSAQEAERLLRSGCRPLNRGVIRAIEAPEIGPPHRNPSPPAITQYMGQRYTYREKLTDSSGEVSASCVDFKYIHPADQELFLLSITDCGGKLKLAVDHAQTAVKAARK